MSSPRAQAAASAGQTPVRLVLASASPSRARVLEQAGFVFEVCPSAVDEDTLHARMVDATPAEVALALARAKAETVAAQYPPGAGVLVLGCDSILELDGQGYGKPHTAEAALARWRAQRGRTASLLTGHWLIDVAQGNAVGRCVESQVSFVAATEAEIHDYVATGEPLGVAGAFTLEGRAGPLISAVHGDPSNVLGISLPGLRDLLGQSGYTLADVTAPPLTPED